MIQELHQKKLSPLPPMPMQQGEYYAVDYVKNFYIGRVLDATTDCVQFKFVHKVGATTFHSPRRDDVDKVHISIVFYGPVTVPNFISGPFTIPEQPAVENLFKVIRKLKKVNPLPPRDVVNCVASCSQHNITDLWLTYNFLYILKTNGPQ